MRHDRELRRALPGAGMVRWKEARNIDKRFTVVATLSVLVSIALAACGGAAKPPSAFISALDLEVIDEREIEVDSGRILSMSPDGLWLAVDSMSELCIYEIESMDEKACVNYGEHMASLSYRTLAWSPDSTRLVFCEDALRPLHESDLWLLEIETGDLRNLTDDDTEGAFLRSVGENAEFTLDFAPAWSPDGSKLVFTRSEATGGELEGTGLFIMDAQGGEPESLVRVSRDEPLAVWYGLYWSAKPERVFYSVVLRDADDPDSGVWVVDPDGRDDEQILEAEDAEQGPPLLMGVSEGANLGLVWYYLAAGRYAPQPNVSHYALADLDTGEIEPLKQASGDELEFFGVTNATLSPDGSKVAYVYRDMDMTWYLVVRDVAGGEENILFKTDVLMMGGGLDFGLGLDWALNDMIYVWTNFQTGLLLELGAD